MMCECDWYFQLCSPPCTKQVMIIVFIPFMTCFVHGGEWSWKYQSHSHIMDHMMYKDNAHDLLRTWRGAKLKIWITFTHHGSYVRYKDNDHGLLRTWRGVELKISITFTHHEWYVRYKDNDHGLLRTWRGAELKISITFTHHGSYVRYKAMIMACFVHGGERSWKYQSHSHIMDHMWGIKKRSWIASYMAWGGGENISFMMCECDWYFQLRSTPCTKQAMIIVFIPHIWSMMCTWRGAELKISIAFKHHGSYEV
jgi:ribosomal protein L39E